MNTELETSNPALDAARAEHHAIATDPEHPKHEGYKKGDGIVSAYLDSLYRKAFPQTPAPPVLSNEPPPLVPHGGVSLTTDLTGQDRLERAQADALTALKQEFGDDFTPDIPQDASVIQAGLQQEWGHEFESRWAGAMNVRSQLMHRHPQLFMEAALLLGDARGLRLLDAIRQTIAAYRH